MTTTTHRDPVAIIARAPCGHAVAMFTAEPAYAHRVTEEVESGRRDGREFELVYEAPAPGALQPSCPRCRLRRLGRGWRG